MSNNIKKVKHKVEKNIKYAKCTLTCHKMSHFSKQNTRSKLKLSFRQETFYYHRYDRKDIIFSKFYHTLYPGMKFSKIL